VRCFLAIELPDDARRHAARVQTALRVHFPDASYPRAENLHVTLKFLGEAGDRQVALLCESMRHIKVDGVLELAAERMDFFPNRSLARVIVASMAGSEGIVSALHVAIEQRCRKLGFDAENRKYHPHITLGRASPGVPEAVQQRLRDVAAGVWPGPRFMAGEFVLLHSELSPKGSRYIKLASFPLGV
jgi:2'-5' RNA ligase